MEFDSRARGIEWGLFRLGSDAHEAPIREKGLIKMTLRYTKTMSNSERR